MELLFLIGLVVFVFVAVLVYFIIKEDIKTSKAEEIERQQQERENREFKRSQEIMRNHEYNSVSKRPVGRQSLVSPAKHTKPSHNNSRAYSSGTTRHNEDTYVYADNSTSYSNNDSCSSSSYDSGSSSSSDSGGSDGGGGGCD